MKTNRRTFFAALSSSVAALIAIAKGDAKPALPWPERRLEAHKLTGKRGLQFTSKSNVRTGEMLYLSSDGMVSPVRRDPYVPIGVAINSAEANGIVTVYFD